MKLKSFIQSITKCLNYYLFKNKKMKSKDLTPQQRIEILEDVLKKLESGDMRGGLCFQIQHSGYKLFEIWDFANEIIPLFTLENAKSVTEVRAGATEGIAGEGNFWWKYFFGYDFENRIKFVKWMIEMEKLTNNI